MSLTAKTPSSTYKDLLQVDNSNSGIDGNTRRIKDGEGTESVLSVSDDILAVQPVNDNTASTLTVNNRSGSSLFFVNTTDNKVSALGNNVNTQYTTFSLGYTEASAFVANTHHPLTHESANYGNATLLPNFGTSTDPATSFTTSDTNKERASDVVPLLWYVPDAISIDSVTSIEGADNATGDTTRMHLFSYDYNNASTSALTNGTLLAHNSDVTNAGCEQLYKTTWTVDSASVAGGKVVVATFRSDSVNSDYSLKVVVKYHLT